MNRYGFALLLSLASSLLLASSGCSSKDTTEARLTGKSGESCQSRADCAADLSCFNHLCTAQGQAEDAGVDVATAQPVVQSQAGESCSARIDCVLGLLCVNNVCLAPVRPNRCGRAKGGRRARRIRVTRAPIARRVSRASTAFVPRPISGIAPSAKTCVAIYCTDGRRLLSQDQRHQLRLLSNAVWRWRGRHLLQVVQRQLQVQRRSVRLHRRKQVPYQVQLRQRRGTTCPSGYVCNAGTEFVRCLGDADCGSGQACTPDTRA